MEEKIKFCYNCGQKLPIIANYCVRCGANQANYYSNIEVDNQDYVYTTKTNKHNSNTSSVLNIISRSLILALSIVMIVFAFLPTMSLTYDGDKIANFNTIDTICLMFDSFESLSDDKLNETKEYKEMLQIINELGNVEIKDFNELTNNQKDKFNTYIHHLFTVSLKSEETSPSVDLILCGIFSIIYLVFIVGFFVVSLLSFIGIFASKLEKKKNSTIVFLTLTPGVAVIIYYLSASIISNAIPTVIGLGLLLTIILSLLIIVVELIFSFICKIAKLKLKDVIYNTIKVVLSTVLIFLVFTPFFVSTVENKDATINNNVFTFYSYSYGDKDLELLKEWGELDLTSTENFFKLLVSSLNSLTKEQLEDGLGNSINIVLLEFAAATIGYYEVSFVLFILIPIFTLLALMMVVILFQQSIMHFLIGKRVKALNTVVYILQTVFITIAFALTITFLIIVQTCSLNYYCSGYSIKISIGIILLFVFSVGLLITSALHNDKKNNLVQVYDTLAVKEEATINPTTPNVAE